MKYLLSLKYCFAIGLSNLKSPCFIYIHFYSKHIRIHISLWKWYGFTYYVLVNETVLSYYLTFSLTFPEIYCRCLNSGYGCSYCFYCYCACWPPGCDPLQFDLRFGDTPITNNCVRPPTKAQHTPTQHTTHCYIGIYVCTYASEI